MEKPKKLHTKQRQFEILVDFMVEHKELAKGHLQAANAKQVAHNLWTKLSDDLNSNGPPVRDIAGWKKVWSDLKNHTKIKMRKNKLSVSGTGGGPSEFCPLSSTEEQIVSLLNMEEAVNGMPMASCFGVNGDNTNDVSLVEKDVSQENLEPPQHNSKFNENLHAAKRPRLSNVNERDNLLKTQVENQDVFHKENTKVLGEIRNDLKDLVRYNRKIFELKEKKLAFAKEKFKFQKECEIQKQKLKLEKLELKKRILELETTI